MFKECLLNLICTFCRENGTKHLCESQSCQKRKLSFTQEPDNEPALMQGTALILGTDLMVPHISDALMDAVNGMEKELTCISEEGIADMDLPDNLLDDLDFENDDIDIITSCNKVCSQFGSV